MQKSRFKIQTLPSLFAFCILNVALLASGCAKAQAASVPNGPPLEVPEPPARVLLPIEEPPVAAATPPPQPEAPPATAAPPAGARPAAPKPQPPVVTQQTPPPPAATDARELRPGSPQTTPLTERSVRDLLTRAQRDLARVDYGRLSADGRAQYDQSKRFSAQAEQALKERNLTFASTLADKAAQLAAELVGR